MAASSGMLECLITDFWNPFGDTSVRLAKRSGSNFLQSLAGRRHDGLTKDLVHAHYRVALEWRLRRFAARAGVDTYNHYAQEGRQFSNACVKLMKHMNFDTFFGFSSAALETLRFVRSEGKFAVVDQIDPARIEDEIVFNERRRFPKLEKHRARIPESYFHRLENEWSAAHRIIVNSSWTRDALLKQGVEAEKIKIVPLPFRRTVKTQPRQWKEPLRVLWLGTMCLRKGIQYAIHAAEILAHANAPIVFTMAGQKSVDLREISIPRNVTVVGYVPRISSGELYRNHDVFILPTLSDGFALTLVEAMAFGLPVISTDRCGNVVQDGLSGHIIPPANPQKLAEALLGFLDEKCKLARMSLSAIKRAEDFSPENIWPHYRRALFG